MEDLERTGSESDVSSDSSWTMLGEEDGEKEEDLGEEEQDKPEIIEEQDCATTKEEPEAEKEEPAVQGCQTLQEYLRDRQIIHDYGYDERAEHWEEYVAKRGRKRKRRTKSDVVSAFKVMGAFLSIAGLTFACVLLPKTSGPPTSVEPRRYYRNHYPQAINEDVARPKPPNLVLDSKPLETAQEALKVIRHNHSNPPSPLPPPPKEMKKCDWNKPEIKPPPPAAPKLKEKSFFDDVKQRITDALFSTESKSNTFKANLFFALHILNDLVLIRATGQLRRDIESRLRNLKSKKPQLTKRKKQSCNNSERKRELFKELPFENKLNYIEFFHELQEIKARKIELLKTLNAKARKAHMHSLKQDRKLDKYYLNHKYDGLITDAVSKEELFCCLYYLHARKRDFCSLVTKLDVGEVMAQSPKYQSLLEKLFLVEDALVQYFQAGKPVGDDIAPVVDLLTLRLKRKKKDASTERYVVPIASNANILSAKASQTESNFAWPIKTETIAQKISQEKIEVLKTWKQKYEQLKQFWKSRQEYYDRRVEICDLIKEIIPHKKQKLEVEVGNSEETILDELIHEVINKNEDNSTRESRVLIQNVATDLRQVLKKDEGERELWTAAAPWKTYNAVFERKGKEIFKSDQRMLNGAKYPRVIFKQIPSKQDPAKAHPAKNLITLKTP